MFLSLLHSGMSVGVFFLAFSESVCACCELRLVEFGIIYMYIYGYVVIFILLFFMDILGFGLL